MKRLLAVIWCIWRVFVTLETDRRDSAVPDETTPASTTAPVQPLSHRRVPNDFSVVISMYRPPNLTRYLSSPYRLGHCHCTYFARAQIGWSAVMTGTWPGFRKATASHTFCITCLIVATEWARSLSSGSNEVMLTSNSGLLLQDAWCADQVRLIAPSISSLTQTFSNHWYSSASCGPNTFTVWTGTIWGKRVLCFEWHRWDIDERIRELWNRLDFWILGFELELMMFLSFIFFGGMLTHSPMERCGSSCCRRIVINIIHHCSGEQTFAQYWWTDHALYILANCGIS